jgi:hypothetical protein
VTEDTSQIWLYRFEVEHRMFTLYSFFLTAISISDGLVMIIDKTKKKQTECEAQTTRAV